MLGKRQQNNQSPVQPDKAQRGDKRMRECRRSLPHCTYGRPALSLPETPRLRAWALAQAVHDGLAYVPGATGVATTAAQAFHEGRGVCQDFAHVYLALARQAGLAARYVNGLPQGEGVSHAWCEVWLDGLWTGIDPTRLQWTNEGYLRFGAGRDFGDCPIERGVFLGSARQEQQVFMRVSQQSR